MVDDNAATNDRIRRLESALREKANLGVLAVVAMGDRPAPVDRVILAPAMAEPSRDTPVKRSGVGGRRRTDTCSSLDVFPSESDSLPR